MPVKSRLSLAAAMALCAGVLAGEETVVLQQGVSPDKSYAGCQTATLWPQSPNPVPPDSMLYLRGERNRMLVKFDLPANLKGKTLARARLWVFPPKVMWEAYDQV